jgi:hypothetical protein
MADIILPFPPDRLTPNAKTLKVGGWIWAVSTDTTVVSIPMLGNPSPKGQEETEGDQARRE